VCKYVASDYTEAASCLKNWGISHILQNLPFEMYKSVVFTVISVVQASPLFNPRTFFTSKVCPLAVTPQFLHFSTWQPLVYCLCICQLCTSHVWTQYLVFSIWLCSLSIVLKIMHVVTWISISLFCGWIIFHYIDKIIFYLSVLQSIDI
jgi:hypothetical protein